MTILGVFTFTTFAQTKYFSRYSQLAWNDYSASALLLLVRCLYCAHVIPALIISLVTVRELISGVQPQQTFLPSQRQGSNLTILIMNCGNFIYLFTMVTAVVLGSPLSFTSHSMILTLAPLEFVYAVMAPCVLAAFNPAVIFLCSTSMRSRWARGTCFKVLGLVNVVLQRGPGQSPSGVVAHPWRQDKIWTTFYSFFPFKIKIF